MNKKFIIIICVCLILSITVILFLVSGRSSTKNDQPQTPSAFSPIPTQSSIKQFSINAPTDDVLKAYGKPDTITRENDFTIYSYNIPGTARSDKVYLQNNKVKYILHEMTLDNYYYVTYQKQLDKRPDGVLYDKANSEAGFLWYVFAPEGKAFLANTQNGYTIEVLEFPPSNYQNFLQTTAKYFSLQDNGPKHNEQFQ